MGRKGYAEIGAALLDPVEDGALHDRGKAAAHGFDFGELGHVTGWTVAEGDPGGYLSS
jgi:hypothetical protein